MGSTSSSRPSVLEPIAARGIPIVYTVHDYKPFCPA